MIQRLLTAIVAVLALALVITLAIKFARANAPPPAPVAAAVVEFSPAEYAARQAAQAARLAGQAARQAKARAQICLEFERGKSLPPGVAVTPATAEQHYRYLDALATDAATWHLDASIQMGLALMRDPTTDAREYWRAAEIVSRTCAAPASQSATQGSKE